MSRFCQQLCWLVSFLVMETHAFALTIMRKMPSSSTMTTSPSIRSRGWMKPAHLRLGNCSETRCFSSPGLSSSNTEVIQEEIRQLMEQHDPILLFASRLLPPSKAQDAAALYAWCRRLDEITDRPPQTATIEQGGKFSTSGGGVLEELEDWERRFDQLWNGSPLDAMDEALYKCLQKYRDCDGRYSLGKEPFEDMISGMKSDAIPQRRIANMDALEEYSYQVAGTVGLMLLPLLLVKDQELEGGSNSYLRDLDSAREPAIALGKAIQMINILRDATPDVALGRIYLPQDLLVANQVREEDILSLMDPPPDGYRMTVRAVADRAKDLLAQAEAGGRETLPGAGPLFVQIIVELYRGYLEKLEVLNYNNLLNGTEDRVRITTFQKVKALARALVKILFPK